MRESIIEGYLVERALLAGAEIRKVKWLGRRAAPDRCIMFKGATVWVETKSTGKKPDPHQLREHERMRRAGQTVIVIDSIEEVDHLFEMFKKTSNDCPECGRGMLLFSSHKEKICNDCRIVYEWNLNPGQQPLIKHQR